MKTINFSASMHNVRSESLPDWKIEELRRKQKKALKQDRTTRKGQREKKYATDSSDSWEDF